MKSSIKAVILDWAGTSVDYGSMAPVKVFVDIFHEKGIEISSSDVRSFMGLNKREHTRQILRLEHVRQQWSAIYGNEPGEAEIEIIFNLLGPRLADVASELSEPIPGVKEFVDNMHTLGIKVGTTTGYVASMMERIVPEAEKRGFKPDCVVNSSEVPSGRPFPYMCFLNAIRMDVFPLSYMVKIGDTIADVQEGLNAGMWTIGLSKSGNEVGLSLTEMQNLEENKRKELIGEARTKLEQAGAHYVVEGIWDCLKVVEHIEERIRNGERP